MASFLDPSHRSAPGGFLRFAIPPQLDFFGGNLALASAEAAIRSSIASYLGNATYGNINIGAVKPAEFDERIQDLIKRYSRTEQHIDGRK
jgi:hypothetical protein